MRNILITITLLLGCLSLQALLFLHDQPHSYSDSEDLVLALDIPSGLDQITSVTLCYRSADTAEYTRRLMNPPEAGFTAYTLNLKPAELAGLDYVYYFELQFSDSRLVQYPDVLQGEQPFSLMTEELPGTTSWDFVHVSSDDQFSQRDSYLLVISYLGMAGQIEPGSIKLAVNGKDVTSRAVITDNALVYKDQKAKAGTYKAVVTATAKNGEQIKSGVFTTKVSTASRASKFDIFGRLYFVSNLYRHDSPTANGIPGNELPESDLSGGLDFSGRFKKMTLSSNLFLTNREDQNRQPVDRLRIGLELPSLILQAGDHVPQISKLVMHGRNNRGFYGKLYGKYMAVELSLGEMVRKTLNEGAPGDVTAFRQEALGGRIRLGMENGLSLGLNFSRNRDLISSLLPEEFVHYDAATLDTLFVVAPRDNLVLSVDARVNLPWLRSSFGGELATSLLTRNSYLGAGTPEDIEQYVEGFEYIDPADLQELIILNRTTAPGIPGRFSSAATAWLRSYILRNQIYAQASLTGPAFNALSGPTIQKDVMDLQITDMFNLGRNFLVSGSYQRQEDNYSRTASETQLSESWLVNANLRLFRKFSLKGSYFKSSTKNEDNPEFVDGFNFVRFRRDASSYTVGLAFNSSQTYYWPYLADLSYSVGEDGNQAFATDQTTTQNRNSNINLSLASKLGFIPLRLQLLMSLGARVQDDGTGTGDSQRLINHHYSVKALYPLFRERVNPYLIYRAQRLLGDQDRQNYDYWTLGLETNLIRNLDLRTTLSSENYKNAEDANLNRNTLTWGISIEQRF